MNSQNTPARWWQMPAMILGFILLYLAWNAGSQWFSSHIVGTTFEACLNWLSNAWFWLVIIAFVIGIAFSALRGSKA